MNRLLKVTHLILFFIVAVPAFMYAQSSADIELAKRLAKQQGYSDAQIEAMLKSQTGNAATESGRNGVKSTDRNASALENNNNQLNVGESAYGVVGEDKKKQMQQQDLLFSEDWRQGGDNSGFRSKSMIFGHDLFKNKNLNFVPSYNIPTPENYRLSAGDEVVIDVWGAVVTNITTEINPEGSIYIPDLGPVFINGQTVAQAEKSIKEYLSKIYSGINDPIPNTFVKVALGKIKSVTVNVIGDVDKPGSYTLPSLSSVASALYLAGGPTDLGTVREIKVFRNNKLLSTFDVYEFLVAGKFDKNVRLEDNDVIVTGPYSGLVYALGSVKRPLKYEIKEGESLSELFLYCGGFADNAYTGAVQVDRKKADGDKVGAVAKTYNVSRENFDTFKLMDGDVVTVRPNDDRFANKVQIDGAVWRPGAYSISDTLGTLKQLLIEAGGVKDNAYLDKGYIVRLGESRNKEQVSFSLKNVILGGENITLMPDDRVKIFYIDSLTPQQTIVVAGEVNKPDDFEYRKGMTLGDAILMANGPTDAATLERIDIARRIMSKNEPVSPVNLSDTIALVLRFNLLKNPREVDTPLEPFDMVFVRRSPVYKQQQGITVEGEVNYPGTYVIEKNTVRLSDVLKRAEGFNRDAYPYGAKLTRILTKEEFERLKIAMSIAKKQAVDSSSIDSLEIGDRFNIAIDLEAALANPGSYADVVLRNNDIISIPKLNNTVKVSGAVLYPNTITYSPKLKYKQYISNAGGLAKRALPGKIYMVHMNGSVATKGSKDFKVRPGTEIVVPMKDRSRNPQTLALVMSMATSTASLAAMIVTIVNASK